MKILVTISVLSFIALTWAAAAIARHIRRSTVRPQTLAHPGAFAVATPGSQLSPALLPNRSRPSRQSASQRHDRTFASKDSGNLVDPAARISTRPKRKKR